MSGGVDSAVALLRAGAARDRRDAPPLAGPAAPDTRARVLLAGRGRRGARDVPRARRPARDARPARGVQAARSSIRSRAPTKHGETPNPCMRCNGAFRFDELVAFAEPCRSGRAVDGPLRADRRARRHCGSSRGRSDERKDQSYMLAAVDPALLERVRFPLGEQTKEETRAEAVCCRARGRAPRREPGGVLPRWRRLPRLPRAPGAPGDAGRDRRPRRRDARARTTGYWRFTPGQRRGLAPRRRAAALRPRHRRRDEHRHRRRARAPRGDDGRGARPPLRAGRREADVEAALPLGAGRRVRRRDDGRASRSSSTSPRTASRAASSRSCTTTTRSSAPA